MGERPVPAGASSESGCSTRSWLRENQRCARALRVRRRRDWHPQVVVVDVFRASTTIAAALAGGARFVLPVADVEQAMKLGTYAENGSFSAASGDVNESMDSSSAKIPARVHPGGRRRQGRHLHHHHGTQALARGQGLGHGSVGSFVTSRDRGRRRGTRSRDHSVRRQQGRLSLEDSPAPADWVAGLAKRASQLDDAAWPPGLHTRTWGLTSPGPGFHGTTPRRLADLGFRADSTLRSRSTRCLWCRARLKVELRRCQIDLRSRRPRLLIGAAWTDPRYRRPRRAARERRARTQCSAFSASPDEQR